MNDVALRAGVSPQTVSRVLNAPDQVHPETRRRVQDVITALGYRRNMSARTLASRRSRLIGVVTPSVTLFGPTHSAIAIQAAARSLGYATILAATSEAIDSPNEVLDFFLTVGVEGVILLAPTVEMAREAHRLAERIPVTVVATESDDLAPLYVVAIGHEKGARDATAHLIALGHERIAHIAGPSGWFDAQARVDGWSAELRSAGLAVTQPYRGGWAAVDGYRAAQQILAQEERPTAVFAANDYVALGAVHAFREAGMAVPDDIAVVGYDDIPGSDYFMPSLTTVRQPFQELGLDAISALAAVLEGRSIDQVASLPELVVRESTVRATGARRPEPAPRSSKQPPDISERQPGKRASPAGVSDESHASTASAAQRLAALERENRELRRANAILRRAAAARRAAEDDEPEI